MFVRNGPASFTRTVCKPRIRWRRAQLQCPFTTSVRLRDDDISQATKRGSDYDERVRSLLEGGDLARCYPQLRPSPDGVRNMPVKHFLGDYENKLFPNDTNTEDHVQLSGRVVARRTAGSKLVFFDVKAEAIDGPSAVIQVICNHNFIKTVDGPEIQEHRYKELSSPEEHPNSTDSNKQVTVNPGTVNSGTAEEGLAEQQSNGLDSLEGHSDSKDLNEQVTVNSGIVDEGLDKERFKIGCQTIRVGDWITARGHPHSTQKGQLSLLATALPKLMAPQLHQLPEGATDTENISRRTHVKMLMQPHIRDIFRLRMLIEDTLDFQCKTKGLTRVRTPILGTSSGGANAEVFETNAKELSREKLSLRIAPELYLKRLMVGGVIGVYEIGPAFRNEGIDATHNPEFTICEYYQHYTPLKRLISDTEDLFRRLQSQLSSWKRKYSIDIAIPDLNLSRPFKRLNFIRTLNDRLSAILSDVRFQLPDLEGPQALSILHELYSRLKIPLPSNPNIPRVLDDLSARYLEATCEDPTWITGQPACLAPLAKSRIDEKTGQHVSLRAELFIGRREYVNCYEEENSPFEQRKKFLQQREFQNQYRTSDGETADAEAEEKPNGLLGIEESYIEALEWGLPPTGGWGCGVDRLVMLFAGVDRIADVLPFGTLRNVVAMSKPLR